MSPASGSTWASGPRAPAAPRERCWSSLAGSRPSARASWIAFRRASRREPSSRNRARRRRADGGGERPSMLHVQRERIEQGRERSRVTTRCQLLPSMGRSERRGELHRRLGDRLEHTGIAVGAPPGGLKREEAITRGGPLFRVTRRATSERQRRLSGAQVLTASTAPESRSRVTALAQRKSVVLRPAPRSTSLRETAGRRVARTSATALGRPLRGRAGVAPRARIRAGAEGHRPHPAPPRLGRSVAARGDEAEGERGRDRRGSR